QVRPHVRVRSGGSVASLRPPLTGGFMSSRPISIRSAARPRRSALAYLIAAALPAVATPAFAMTFTVDTLSDTISGSGTNGSLRDGLIAVNASSDPSNTIQFQAGLSGTI